jgi:hypothetical protein
MNTAIERIKGYCCEVDKHQWNALLIAAKDVGAKVFNPNWSTCNGKMVVSVHALDNDIVKDPVNVQNKPVIPFPDFLAKLKGDEQWQPKAGEMVEVTQGESGVWESAKYIGPDVAHDGQELMVCVMSIVKNNILYTCFYKHEVRPLRPTITRTEAERLLNKRIID